MIDIAYQPKQQELRNLVYSSGSRSPTWIGAGGPRAGGKSRACRDIMLDRRLRLPGTPGYIVMRRYGKLQDEHIAKFKAERPELATYYNGSLRQYTLPNRSTISFRAADTEEEIMEFARGPEVYDLFIDQAEQFTEAELKWLHTPNRWTAAGPGSAKTVLFFNPGGRGSDFQRRVFHTRKYESEERPSDYAFIKMHGWDNFEWFRSENPWLTFKSFYALSEDERFQSFITATSEGRKLHSLPKHQRESELFGNFDKAGNAYFSSVWEEQTVRLAPSLVSRIVKPWWTRWLSQDWAFSEHAATYWFASGTLKPSEWKELFGGQPDAAMTVVVLYRELIVKEMAEADLAREIVNQTPMEERKELQRFFLSQDAFGQKARQNGAHTVGQQYAETMERYGMPLPEPADQDRKNGWRFMFNCLRQSQLRGATFDAERAKEGPALFISEECPAAIDNIPMATKDPDDLDDIERVPGVLWEDVNDSIRYGLKSMLAAKDKAPRDVRAREVLQQYEHAPTLQALAMRKFQADESRVARISRQPRWRQ